MGDLIVSIKLSTKYKYMIGIDYNTSVGATRPASHIQKFLDTVTDDSNWQEDLRLPMITQITGTLSEKEMLSNYTAIYSVIHNTDNSKIQLYLDFGLIPVCFYPTPLMDYANIINKAVIKSGLELYEMPAEYPICVYGIRTHYDTWVSRLNASEVFGIKPEKLRTSYIFKEVVKCI